MCRKIPRIRLNFAAMVKYALIIPVFNRPDEVDELLQSLTAQTFTDFEVVIDGTDLAKLDTLKNVYFAPIVGTVANSTIENLTASGKLICDRATLEGFESVDLITDGAYVKDLTGGESSFVNISVTVTEEQPIE